MSDDDKHDFGENPPEGMVRKKRKVRKKRRASSTSDSEKDANSLFLRAKELLIGMHDQDEDYGPVDVAEQMRRLKNRKSEDDDKPLDDIWGTKKRSSSWLWIILIGIIAPVIAIIIGIAMLNNSGDGDMVINPDRLVDVKQTVFDPGEGPLGWYSADSLKVLNEVTRIIELFNVAGTTKEIESVVRSSPYRNLNPIDLEEWGAPCLTNALSGFQWRAKTVMQPGGVVNAETGYLEVTGTRVNEQPFKCFFVYENRKVVLDWDATTGWSEMPVAELREAKPAKEMLVRCLIEKKAGYDQLIGKTDYSGYLISSGEVDNYQLVYLPMDSDQNLQIDKELKSILNYGSFAGLPLLKDQPATIRVRFSPNVGKEGIFEIKGLEHLGWVRP